MDPKKLRGLYEAYSEVYAPQEEIDEAVKGESSERRSALASERKSGIKPLPAKEGEKYASYKLAQMDYAKRKRMGEEVDIFDIVLEFLQVEGYAETLEEAEWMMVNELDADDIDAILEAEGSYGATPKAYNAARDTKMTAKRKPFLKKMLSRTNPTTSSSRRRLGPAGSELRFERGIEDTGSYKADERGVGGITRNPKKLRKQKAMGEHD